MKALKWILLVLVFLFLIAGIGILFWLHYLLPDYNGKIKSDLLSSDVDVYYDEYAIPHIYAQNENDAWFALGYVHAQERLFQMEMLRRVGAGRLSEIFGADLINIDKLFRALDISGIAHRSAKSIFQDRIRHISNLHYRILRELTITLIKVKLRLNLPYLIFQNLNLLWKMFI